MRSLRKLSKSKGSTGQAREGDIFLAHLNKGKKNIDILLFSLPIGHCASPWQRLSHWKIFVYYLSLLLNCKDRNCLSCLPLSPSLVQCLAISDDWLTYGFLIHNLTGNRS